MRRTETHAQSFARAGRPRFRARGAFTLVEVILAIVIALGIMVVLLFFYQQSTNLRSQILEETERIAAVRLIMDRLTSELRGMQTAPESGPGFVGSSNSIQFVRADVPSFTSWTGGTLGRSAFPLTDLKLIRYRLESVDGTNVAGLVRSEEPLVKGLTSTNRTEFEMTNLVENTSASPPIEQIRFLQLRYWSGTNWIDTWEGAGFPSAVEVTLGGEPSVEGELEPAFGTGAGMGAPVGAAAGARSDSAAAVGVSEQEPGELPEVFRRVIYIASTGGALGSSAGSTSKSADKGDATEEEPMP